ncbi:MAG: efflux RND transporter permease subunit, partial [Deltaproteobacteria bacterium]|nr:efflux RND transporter permease subunit [Deltaproteobacteria bacterium]
TGRAELDEHAQDVNSAEIDAKIELKERSKEEFLKALRADLSVIPGMIIQIGGPLSHRIDHMLSGTRANIAVKLFGDDISQLRSTAKEIEQAMATVDGIADLSVEQQVDIPQLTIAFDRERIARHGLRAGELAEVIEAAYAGQKVTQVLESQRTYDVIVRYPDANRESVEAVRATLIDTPSGAKVPLGALATIRQDAGPNVVMRENAQRRIVVMANVGGRDLKSVVDDVRIAVSRDVRMPSGYYVVYGGQFESESEATRTIGLLSVFVVAGIFLILFLAFRSARTALLVMVNLPLALIGGVVAVKLGGGILSVASLVGFITLFGIATRNGIMMVSHYEHLRHKERVPFDEAIERGSLERLSPIFMTALCAGLALIPLVIAGDHPGNEIQAPMGVVILGGLLSSTALNMIVLPVLYRRFARPRPASEPTDPIEG